MFAFIPFLINLVIGVALQVLGYLLMPSAKGANKREFDDMDDPTAESGRPMPVTFGEIEHTDVNIIWYGEKATVTREVDA